MTTILIINAASSLVTAGGLLLWNHRRWRRRSDIQLIYVKSRRSPRGAAR
jgi:hypothetical protein